MRGPCPLRRHGHGHTHTHTHTPTQAGLEICTWAIDKMQRQRNRSFWFDDWQGCKRADGTGTCMCTYVHELCQFYPLRCLSCLSTHSTYVSCSSSHWFLVSNPSRHPILCCVIFTSISGLHACLCLLCSIFAECDLFISINTHAFTLQPNLHQRNLLLIFPCLFFSYPVWRSRVGVLWIKWKHGLCWTKFTLIVWSIIRRKMTQDTLSLSNKPRTTSTERGTQTRCNYRHKCK